jgi:hypothetical protein
MRTPPWNDSENEALVALYFEMLDYAIPAKQYSKAGMIRDAIGPVPGLEAPAVRQHHRPYFSALCNRTRGSIEFKLMNATAAHADLGGAITMDTFGYRALPNYQAALKDAMFNELRARDNRLAVEHGA